MDNLPWNGTDLGDITPIWVNTVSSQHHSGVYLYMRPNIVCLAFKFTSSIPLIIDELKPLFGLPKLGRHRCTLNDQALLLQRILDYSEGPRKPEVQNVTLFEKRQIQRYHAFRHLVCLPFSKQREFWFRPSEGYLSYYEVTTKVNEVFPNPALLNIWKPDV